MAGGPGAQQLRYLRAAARDLLSDRAQALDRTVPQGIQGSSSHQTERRLAGPVTRDGT